MVQRTYVANIKDNDFDYEIAKAGKGNFSGYFPSSIYPLRSNGLFSRIIDHKDAVQTDWGCWVVKMSKNDILKHVVRWGSFDDFKALYDFLYDNKEYLLVALEDV